MCVVIRSPEPPPPPPPTSPVRKAYWHDIIHVREILRTHVGTIPEAEALLASVPSAALSDSNTLQHQDVQNFVSFPEGVDASDPSWANEFRGGWVAFEKVGSPRLAFILCEPA